MIANFPQIIEFVLDWEKYWSDRADDPGGLTIWGVCEKYWPKEVEKMKTMSEEASRAYAIDFYKREFWDKSGCNELAWPYDLIVMDAAVNLGVDRANKWRKQARGGAGWPAWVTFLMLRIKFYNASPREDLDDGWINRVLALYFKEILKEEHPLSGVDTI